jgi:hypothetical protein
MGTRCFAHPTPVLYLITLSYLQDKIAFIATKNSKHCPTNALPAIAALTFGQHCNNIRYLVKAGQHLQLTASLITL